MLQAPIGILSHTNSVCHRLCESLKSETALTSLTTSKALPTRSSTGDCGIQNPGLSGIFVLNKFSMLPVALLILWTDFFLLGTAAISSFLWLLSGWFESYFKHRTSGGKHLGDFVHSKEIWSSSYFWKVLKLFLSIIQQTNENLAQIQSHSESSMVLSDSHQNSCPNRPDCQLLSTTKEAEFLI